MTEEQNTAPAEAAETPKQETAPTPEKKKTEDRGSKGGGQRRGRGRRDRKPREPKEFEESILQIDRVTRVTKGGRQLRFRVSVVIGDKKGRVGFGIGKSSEVLGGIRKAVADAKQNLITIPIQNDTIPHAVKAKFKSSQVHLYPAPAGKGVIAGGATRKILDVSGIKNVLAKLHGSRTRINVARSTFQALGSLTHEAPYTPKKQTEETVTTTE